MNKFIKKLLLIIFIIVLFYLLIMILISDFGKTMNANFLLIFINITWIIIAIYILLKTFKDN